MRDGGSCSPITIDFEYLEGQVAVGDPISIEGEENGDDNRIQVRHGRWCAEDA